MMSFFTQFGSYLLIAFSLVVGIQLYFLLRFFMKLARYKEENRIQMQTHPVSVVICAKDEAANLAKYLPGVLVQKYDTTHEVIVVDDNSTDESKYILEAYQKEFRQLQVVKLKQKAMHIPGKKYPLSMGIKAARYEVLLLTDADCVPASEFWLEKMLSHFQNGTEIVLGYSPFLKRKGLLNKLVRWEGFMTAVQYMSYALSGLTYMGVGRNLSYKRKLFFENKGFSAFNHVLSGDDDLFINKVATKSNVAIAIDPDTFTLSNPPATFEEWKKQKKRHYTTSKYYKPAHKFLLSLFAVTGFLFYPLFAAGLIFFHWDIVLYIFLAYSLIRYLVIYYCAKKLDATDLAKWSVLFDIWMFFYYIIFARAPFKKPDKNWN